MEEKAQSQTVKIAGSMLLGLDKLRKITKRLFSAAVYENKRK
jgi:hypothetical protein